MKIKFLRCTLIAAAALCLTAQAFAGGTWIQMTNLPAGKNFGHMHLLTDGTVMSENGGVYSTLGPGWSRLTPDIHGSYLKGTWTNTASMHDTRMDFGSQVLRNGKLFVVGGEYGTGASTAELYDPISDTWTNVPVPAGYIQTGTNSDGSNKGFLDSSTMMLPGGYVLVAPVYPVTTYMTMIYNVGDNSWSTAAASLRFQDEANWVRLPDDSILTVDYASTSSERFIPYNTWVNDANVPVQLYDSFGHELGPAFLLPNGKAIFFGSTSNTAIYTPSPLGGNNPGTWVAGPNFPNGQGMADAPAAMLPNGNILCATATAPNSTNVFNAPVSFYEYNYLANNFTRVSAPGGSNTFDGPAWPTLMLVLPDGSVLFSSRTSSLYIYQPTNMVALSSAKPTVQSVAKYDDGSLFLTGTLFTGISSGAAYGDDEQEDTNFPLVRFTDSSGNIRYGRTYDWLDGVAAGTNVVDTLCTVPSGASLQDTIEVVANGIPSDGVHWPLFSTNLIVWVDYSFTGTSQQGTQSSPFNTIHLGVGIAEYGGTVTIAGGHQTSGGDGIIRITKPMRITAHDGTAHIGPN